MLLNDDPGIMDAKAAEAQQLVPEASERRDSGAPLQWLFPWLLAIAGILITLALTR
jgi:hypothetical protein